MKKYQPGSNSDEKFLLMEFVLHGLAEYSLLSKTAMESSVGFSDLLNSLFSAGDEEDDQNQNFTFS